MEIIVAIITSASGIVGIILGISLTRVLESARERKRQLVRAKKKVLSKFDEIESAVLNVVFILNTIREFFVFQFGENEDLNESTRAVVYFGSLHHEDYKQAWNRMKKTVYLYFPHTKSYRYFVDLEFIMENLYRDISLDKSQELEIAGIQKLIKEKYARRLMRAVAAALRMRDELRSIASRRRLVRSSDLLFFEKLAKETDRIAERFESTRGNNPVSTTSDTRETLRKS